MQNEIVPIVEKLLSMGGQAGMLLLATYYLARTLKGQYEQRIAALEGHVVRCDEDRIQLRTEVRAMQNDRIAKLERAAEE